MYYFEILTNEDGDFYWEWKAPNGNTMMVSPKTYGRKEHLLTAILVIKQHMGGSVIRDRTTLPALLRR